MLESNYQNKLIRVLEKLLPGCIVLKNDANLRQGIPDLLILYKNKWAALEVKASSNEPEQPNQQYWIETMQEMSFASFIWPAVEEEVLDALQQSFRSRR